ncbi:hypothetical protein ABZ894_12215 [Nocardia beijingensis]|uniref:hypothetical protein n=1 Tax=Nocardia beijingensis TaxID=95162 RepID=UPI00340ADF7D
MYLTESGLNPDQPQASSAATRAMPLLGPAHLLQAISGRCAGTLPLVRWARELGDMHAELTAHDLHRTQKQRSRSSHFVYAEATAEIERVVNDIDAWAARHIPRVKCARKHTHSLGEVISHIAKIYAETWWTVLHSADTEARHEAWLRLGEAREGYTEMVNEIRAQHLQLPLGWGGMQSGHR